MSRAHPAWRLLDIEPTEDVRAIRAAYASKLKAFDPDSDPQAFTALRAARDTALRLAARQAQAQPEAEPAREEHTLDAEAEPIPAADRHAHALYAMLYAERDPATPHATAAEREAMLAHWAAITADPRIEEIGFFAQLELWTIGLIANAVPLSDPLIIPATELFGWTESDDTVAQSREVAGITARYGWLSYVEDVQDPDHPWHPLWEELTKPAGPGAKRGRVGPARLRALLEAVRAMRPDLEERFDPARLDLWDPNRAAPPPPQEERGGPSYEELIARRNRRIILTVVACFFALCILTELGKLVAPPDLHRGTSFTVPPPAPLALEKPEIAIDRALDGRFGAALNRATIEAKNPALAASIAALWSLEHGNHATQYDFARDLDRLLDDWYWYGVRNGGRELLSLYLKLSIDMARTIRARDPAACNSFIASGGRWRPDLGLPADTGARETALMIRALLETDGSKRQIPSAMVPGSLIETTARRAHVGIPVVERWLNDPNIGPARCGVTIAFTEATLAQPGQQALAILRTL